MFMMVNQNPQKARRKMIVILMLTMILSLVAPMADRAYADASVYYVGGEGASDGNPGTASAPFATIQQAASVVKAGDTVKIRGGIYRETITPAHSGTEDQPIVYEPDGDAVVTVSGADAADGGWVQHSGHIYKKTISMTNGYNDDMADNATLLANQVFVDGKMMIEARWPNVSNSDDLMNRADWRSVSNSVWEKTDGGMKVTDEAIPDIPDGWAGGQLWITGWYVSATKTIAAHAGTELTLSGGEVADNKREFYYLTGRLGALDTAKEWYYDGTDLYLWAPDGNSPEGVEVKARNYAFDLSGKSNITLKNLHIFAASIISDESSSHLTLDGLKAQYINHGVTLTDSDVIYTHTDQTGIRLIGPNSTIKNSTVAYSSNMGIVLGEGNVADNNLVHDIGYDGTYASGISPVPNTNDHRILHNTIYRLGRSGIDLLHTRNVEIGYNDIYDYGLITNDGGGIYSARQSDLTGTRVHHNWIHDSKAVRGGQGGEKGIYYDQGSGPVLTDHNVLWGNEEDYYNHHDPLDQVDPPKLFETYNNTFGSMEYASYVTYQVPATDIAANNIYRDAILASDNATFAVRQNQDPKFSNLDTDHGGLKYQLLEGSPAVNKGKEIPGITDGFAGSAPDIGAYELGGEAWVPGYQAEGWVPGYYASEQPLPPTVIDESSLSPQGTVIIDDAATDGEDYAYEYVGAWKSSANAAAYRETDHYTKTADDYYSVRFTGTQIHVYGEKNNAFGIVAISIDGGDETLVDAYSETRMPDTRLYASPVLPYGSHTLKVRLTGDKNETSSGTYHTADKVLVVTGAVTIDDAVTGEGDFQYHFVGNWKTSANEVAFKETDHYSAAKDDYYEVSFTGSRIEVYGEKRDSFGIVAVSIDGGDETLVDAYSATRMPNTLLYTSPVLPYGSHKLKVRLTGDKNELAGHTYSTADRVVILTQRVTIDDADEGVEEYRYDFTGNWKTSANEDAYRETDHYSAAKDDYYEVTFTGSQIEVYGEKRDSFGIVAVSIDGGDETLVDAYSETRMPNTLLYTSPVLPYGSHKLKVRLTGDKNELAGHTYSTADRVVITTADLASQTITRAEFIDMLVRALGLQPKQGMKPFEDTVGHWAQESISIARLHGIINGIGNHRFGPDDVISREQMALILVKALGLESDVPKQELAFTDAGNISPWAKKAVRIALELGLIRGYPNGTLQPQQALTRAEADAAIVRMQDILTD